MILEVHGLTKQYGGLIAVNEVDFSIKKGTIFSIIGPNGAGKTTMFNLISGTEVPTKGSIIFCEDNLVGMKPNLIAQKGITRTFQTTSVFSNLTAEENLLTGYIQKTKSHFWGAVFHTKEWKRERQEAYAKTEEIIEFIDLKEKSNSIAASLNQEEQKKLAIGIALMSDPKILLLDEPTGGLIEEDTNKIIRLIVKMKEMGITICLVEHKMNMVMNLADDILVMNFGKAIAYGKPAEICKNPEVIKAYLGRDYDVS